MTFAVIGTAGFRGSHVAPMLRDCGEIAASLDNRDDCRDFPLKKPGLAFSFFSCLNFIRLETKDLPDRDVGSAELARAMADQSKVCMARRIVKFENRLKSLYSA